MAKQKKERAPRKLVAQQTLELPQAIIQSLDGAPKDVAPFVTPTREPAVGDMQRLTLAVDTSEYRVLETYTKLWNDRHADIPEYAPVTPEMFVLHAALRWCEYEERGGVDGMVGEELGAEEDATPHEEPGSALIPDPADDDPEFVEAFSRRAFRDRL